MARSARRLLPLFVLGAVALALPALAERLTYEQILGRLTDLDALARLEPGVTAGQYSSYSREEETHWATNADAGNFLRIEPNGEGVMMDQDGPGCIVRIWSANPEGTLRIYIDGAAEPTVEVGFNDLFLGTVEPFVAPLVWKRRPEPWAASNCYLPIPYAKHVKVTCDAPVARFYQVGYLSYPKSWEIESFRLPLSPGEIAARDAAAAAWSRPGVDPKPVLPGQTTVRTAATLAPGESLQLARLTGPGVIRALRVRAESGQREYWRKLVLRGVWDDAREPQVLSPLGPFFGFSGTAVEYESLVAGYRDGQCWFYYPMPFRRSAELTLTSHLEQPAAVEVEIEWAPQPPLPGDTLTFHARWRKEVDSKSLDYPFIETAGRGHLVGVTLQIDHPIDGWWGEGDEKIWIDDESFPQWIGTGSEDYFGDAWGILHLSGQSWGCSGDPATLKRLRTDPYRWHFVDPISFSKRLRMTIENYGPWPQLTLDEFEYASVAYWYQLERTPPWEALRGARYVGGVDYRQTPAEYEYRTDLFPTRLTAEDVRTGGLSVPFALEGEDLVKGAGTVLTDARLPFELNHERALDLGAVAAGARVAEFTVSGREPGVYFPMLLAAPVDGAAEVTLEWDGRILPVVGHPADGRWELEGVVLGEKPSKVALIAVTAGRAVFDALQLRAAPRRGDALEAEELRASAVGTAPRPQAGPPHRGVSGGRTLDFLATAEGQAFALRVPAPANPAYVASIQPEVGPDCGIVQAFVAGEPIGAPIDLYAPATGLFPGLLPLGPLPEGAGKVLVRVVGRNPASGGHAVRLDCFRYEARIVHPESAEGVYGYVAGTNRCSAGPQDLGERWLNGHHLWACPCERDGFMDVAFVVPEEGDYVLGARYTTARDYAIGQAFLDGQPLGGRLDFYIPEGVEQTPPVSYGVAHLSAGTHVFRLQAVDKNPRSIGHLLGLCYLRIDKAQ